MLADVYDRHNDGRDVYLASSEDGTSWSWVPGGPVIRRGGGLGSWYGGDLIAGQGLVPLPHDGIGIPVVGFSVPHKYSRRIGEPLGNPGWAVWRTGRLSAIVADTIGEFSTLGLAFEGDQLSLNLATMAAGSVRLELRSGGEPIPGFCFDDCDPIVPDSVDHTVTCNGNASVAERAAKPVKLAFKLCSAKLFSFELTTTP